ncbi:MAG TPA: serine/threonine protein kinase, partial [Planctomycetaceae bacterium]|nr:serine/threonine protein kinase [Planctomycetaceae bacterium]
MNSLSGQAVDSGISMAGLGTGQELPESLVSRLIEQWSAERALDARAVLDEHPELWGHKSVVLALAYEEFCQRIDAGQSVDGDAFCRKFPAWEKSLRRLISFHEYLEENPHLLPAAQVEWPRPGQEMSGFAMLAELGRGTFGRVYLAREVNLGGRLVAVKVSLDGAGEADILGRLSHPSIVPVHSVQRGPSEGLTIICMPYLGPVTLFDVMDKLGTAHRRPTGARHILEAIRQARGQWPPGQHSDDAPDPELLRGSFIDGVLHLIAQLADALAFAHAQGICHSDLKPSNVLITAAGRPMLLDFNLAGGPEVLRRRLGGTLPYMAPEQIEAMVSGQAALPAALAVASDLFGLGVILYELVSGRLPFGPVSVKGRLNEVAAKLLRRQRQGPWPLEKTHPQIDPCLARLIHRCLAYEAENRPASADELAAALRRHRSPFCRARRWARRRWLVSLSVAAGLVVSPVAVAYYVASRPAAAVRWFNQAGSARQRSRYHQAEDCLSEVIRLGGPRD